MIKERTLTELRNSLRGRVYIRLANEEIGNRFLQDAENEGYRFGKIKPTDNEWSSIIALEKNKKLSYVGFVGHMHFGCAGEDPNFHRVDYQRYVNGDTDYFFREEHNFTTRDIKGKFIEKVTLIGDKKKKTADYIAERIDECNSLDEEIDLYDEAMNVFDTIVLYDED